MLAIPGLIIFIGLLILLYSIGVKDTSGQETMSYNSLYLGNNETVSKEIGESSYNILNGLFIEPKSYSVASNGSILEVLFYNKHATSPTKQVISLPGDHNPKYAGQCVIWVEYITGLNYSGHAKSWENYTNSNHQHVGDVVVFNIGPYGHIGLVIAIDGDKITVRSRNFRSLWEISDDTFNISDPSILGYINY